MSLNQHPMLNVALNIVRKAGQLLVEASLRKQAIVIESKSANDIVTNIDIKVEEAIIRQLKKSFPSHKILSEEQGMTGNLTGDYLWILDPIDGTRNFSHLHPHYCISLALQYKLETELAIIYQTSTEYLFFAVRGEGAYMSERRIRVSDVVSAERSLICLGSNPVSPDVSAAYRKTASKLGPVRLTCAYALDLAYVAAGIFDGLFIITEPKIWDIAAGILLVQEAGGMIINPDNCSKYVEGPLIAGNPKMTQKIFEVYQQSCKDHPIG